MAKYGSASAEEFSNKINNYAYNTKVIPDFVPEYIIN